MFTKGKLIICCILLSVLLFGCRMQKLDGECLTDEQCVPDQCCHASDCVPKELAPDCAGIYCTQDCVPNTLDCQQGRCICKNQECTAEFY